MRKKRLVRHSPQQVDIRTCDPVRDRFGWRKLGNARLGHPKSQYTQKYLFIQQAPTFSTNIRVTRYDWTRFFEALTSIFLNSLRKMFSKMFSANLILHYVYTRSLNYVYKGVHSRYNLYIQFFFSATANKFWSQKLAMLVEKNFLFCWLSSTNVLVV